MDQKQKQKLILWTLILCLMIAMMIVIGAVTRLTGSGLSIVEWKPLMGAIPPLTTTDWLEVFNKYQNSPQYQLVNQGMSLSEFQWIFFWEYFHRLLGRLMGVVFLIPWAFFWWKGILNRSLALRYLIGFLLGGLQGAVGWIMVASGLVNQPQVSHYRLALHLLLAFFILSYFWRLVWTLADEQSETKIENLRPNNLSKFLNVMLGVIVLQIFYGALVAGLRAGFIFNTFPDMNGEIFPLGAWSLLPQWKNIFENPILVQWIHRTLAWCLLLMSLFIVFKFGFKETLKLHKNKIVGLLAVIGLQFTLGILTLIFKVPLPVAVLHQVGAALVLLYLLWLRWSLDSAEKV